jgi:ABC-type lipoprotein export system ATPase subunit
MFVKNYPQYMIELYKIKPFPLIENGISPASEIFDFGNSTIGSGGRVFEKGKKYLVIAPSGKGKSTMLHLIYGLRNDYEGIVKIEGKDIKTLNYDDWADIRQKKLSIVFQDLRLFLNLTARENIVLKNALTDTPSVSEMERMCEQLGISPFMNQKCETLSYGQRQRVAIIRALCQPFDMLLLDELFSNLDTDNIKIATELINTACEKNKAGLILVSLGDEYFFDYDEKLTL